MPQIPTPNNKRVNQTGRALKDALIALTLEKGYDTISIRNITERANISYATFFRHFTDKDALLEEVLEGILTRQMELIEPFMSNDPERSLFLIFEHVSLYSDAVRVLLRTRNFSPLLPRLLVFGTQVLLELYDPNPESIVSPEIAVNHMMVSFVDLVEWWLDHQMPYTPERMGQIANTLIFEPTRQLAFLEK